MNTIRNIFCLTLLFLVSQVGYAKTQAILDQGRSSLTVTEEDIIVRNDKKAIIHLESFYVNYEKISNWQIQSHNENQITLSAKVPPSIDYYRTAFDNTPRTLEVDIYKTTSGYRFYSKESWARQISLEFKYLGDRFFGLSEALQPDNRLSPDLTGGSIVVDVLSEGASMRENYASAFSAFYMSSHGYGAFYDTFAQGKYDFSINGKNRIHHETGLLDWHIFIGDNGTDIHKQYFQLIGKPKYVPVWGLGPIGWRDHNTGSQEILDDIQKLTEMEIPLTAWFVDRPYSDGNHAWSKMNFSQPFANPKSWIEEINDKYGLEFMTWITTSTFGDYNFDKHLTGSFSYIDLTHAPTVNAFQKKLTDLQHSVNVKGHKIDRTDEFFAEHEAWTDNTPLPERRNKYTWLVAKTIDDVLEDAWQEDQLTFARAAIHRTQPYLSAIWGGDPRTTWEGLQANFANAIRSSYMGFPVWGTDVGGYSGEGYIPEDLYIRWMQAGSMTGLFEIKFDGAGGEGRDRMPWRYDEEFQARFKEICEDRMRFLPYLHSLAATSGENGVLMKPMAYRHLSDKNTWQIWDQFYLGDAILVAPIFTAENERRIYLPEGTWRDFNDPDKKYSGGKWISYEADLDTFPRFIQENAIFLQGDTYFGNMKNWLPENKQLTIVANPAEKRGTQQFIYVDSETKAQNTIVLEKNKRTITLRSAPFSIPVNIELLIDSAPESVQLSGKETKFTYSKDTSTLTLGLQPNTAIQLKVEM